MSTSHQLPRTIRFYRWIWRFWKARRFSYFIEKLKPQMDEHLLDIGGYPFNWFARGDHFSKVDVLNLTESAVVDIPEHAPQIRALVGDARQLDFEDNAYAIVFSNSVIEHVGDFNDQAAFAREARRVGRKLWIQTPAKECLIEPHFIGVFLHWFPARWHAWLARVLSVRGLSGAAATELQEIAATTRLLSRREMRLLFPDCTIWTEKMFGCIPKSHVAYRIDPS